MCLTGRDHHHRDDLCGGRSSSRELPFSGVINSIDVLRINEGGT